MIKVKDFIITKDKVCVNYVKIYRDGGGDIPNALKGVFSCDVRATKAIKKYVDNYNKEYAKIKKEKELEAIEKAEVKKATKKKTVKKTTKK